MTNNNHHNQPPDAMAQRVAAARHVCQEARVVLTSLRGGPPHVARGDLAQDLMDLRNNIPVDLQQQTDQASCDDNGVVETGSVSSSDVMAAAVGVETTTTAPVVPPGREETTETKPSTAPPVAEANPKEGREEHEQAPKDGITNAAEEDGSDPPPQAGTTPAPPPPPPPTLLGGPYARPFLQVVMDPRAAGPHTLVALRSIHRLLEAGSFQFFNVSLADLTAGVLQCKFEQTDPGADEAVEMAIADVICALVRLDCCSNTNGGNQPNSSTQQQQQQQQLSSELLTDAFNTVFITRNTFVHSPALCYHFEDVLINMVRTVFQRAGTSPTARLVLEFLVNQLLHTPLVGGDGLDESTREAQMAHDATRVLCLRLVQTALTTGWGNDNTSSSSSFVSNENGNALVEQQEDPALLRIVQDDLCLSLLMTGQAIWAYHDAHTNISPGFVSVAVLSEICATFSLLWNTLSLRQHLVAQFETIFTGFYTRALVLLRQRKQPTDSVSFNANLIFDAEVEIILESLVDLLCLHDHRHSIAHHGDGGSLESLFCLYDCHLRRSDVAMGLMVELCRCCGGTADVDSSSAGMAMAAAAAAGGGLLDDSVAALMFPGGGASGDGGNNGNDSAVDAASSDGGAGMTSNSASQSSHSINQAADTPSPTPVASRSASSGGLDPDMVQVSSPPPQQQPPSGPEPQQQQFDGGEAEEEQPWRHVPAHLKELCAQALMGGMMCLFRDDHASAETMLARSKRNRSILSRQLSRHDASLSSASAPSSLNSIDLTGNGSNHKLRHLKSKKRLMRKAAQIFNKKASRGIAFLLDAGLVGEGGDQVTPAQIAAFLRNGIVVGLDKKAVGAYLGEAGKAPMAGKSPPCWERDWFHKDVLQIYCSLFRFEQQSLLDGLRMFLAAFRLPGEAQQIDRILQAFSDSCGQVCEESVNGLQLFSQDPKRASDAAYLLSFSIIMLNTDQHNTNIRQDRKMSMEDFVRNNTDYGRDITERGKELPREYLEGIYKSIREEEIRTEAEGADGAMTVERWKDVIRCSQQQLVEDDEGQGFHPSQHDVEDLTELVLEHTWKPIVSAIGALWGAAFSRYTEAQQQQSSNHQRPSMDSSSNTATAAAHGGMLGVQGARLGMDMALDLMSGVRQMGRIDIFRKIFSCVCDYTGLVRDYTEDGVERAWALTNSVEAQSAVVVAFQTAADAGEDLDEDSWRLLWSILFELRDLKLIARGSPNSTKGIFHESDADLLSEGARRDWNMCLAKGDMEYDVAGSASKPNRSSGVGLFGAFGRAIFGADDLFSDTTPDNAQNEQIRSAHGKEELVVWDEGAPSDDEAESTGSDGPGAVLSAGAQFESQVIRESMDMSRQMDMPVTGLERVEETRRYQLSPRARVRDRLRRTCSIENIVGDSRFLGEDAIQPLLRSLVSMIAQCSQSKGSFRLDTVSQPPEPRDPERSMSETSSSASSFVAIQAHVPISPASEAFAEVLISEIALKNKDRLKDLWKDVLQDHYLSRLTSILVNPAEGNVSTKIPVDPGLEKRVSGLMRLSIYAIQRPDIANEVLSSWKYLLPMNSEQHATSPLRALDRHMGEGLWRIVARADDLLNLREDGWEGLVALFNWCAVRGSSLKPIRSSRDRESVLPEDDVAIQCYRSLHLILSTKELEGKIPCSIAESLRISVSAGERRNYSQLSVATLDLLGMLYEKQIVAIQGMSEADQTKFWQTGWRKIVVAIAEASEHSSDSNVRQHSLSMLTDLFLDKQGKLVPVQQLCGVLSEVCVPVAGRCIARLQMGNSMVSSADELLIEYELCIGLIFKPLRHHIKNALSTDASLSPIWKSVLVVLVELLGGENSSNKNVVAGDGEHLHGEDERHHPIPESLRKTMNNLANEHFQNAIMVLISAGVLLADSKAPDDITALTWDAARRIGVSEGALQEWKQAAAAN